jgi:ribosomal protein L11 methylase PrmA
VYDLGCGDGRIVIEAAKVSGVRGVCVEIDEKLIQEARQNAEKAGVAKQVEFIQQDLFQVPLRDATVVTLYLLPSVNMRLRPRLMSELRPGTRIVSHSFDMGDWAPEERVEIDLPLRRHILYRWVVTPQ